MKINFKNYINYLAFCSLVTCNIYAQVTELEIQKEENINLDFNEILNCSNLIIIKDSFDYYFNKTDDLVNTKDGVTLSCGLRSSTNQYKREYFYLESDSTLLLLKKMNLSDSSYTITFLKNELIENIEGKTRGCWNEYFVKIEFDKNGKLMKIINLNNENIINPKKIKFK